MDGIVEQLDLQPMKERDENPQIGMYSPDDSELVNGVNIEACKNQDISLELIMDGQEAFESDNIPVKATTTHQTNVSRFFASRRKLSFEDLRPEGK